MGDKKTTFAELSARLAEEDAPQVMSYPRRTAQNDPDTMSFEAKPEQEEIPAWKDVAAGVQLRLGRRYGQRSRPTTPEARRAQATEDAYNAMRAGKANWYDVQFFQEMAGTALDTMDPDAVGPRWDRFQELREQGAVGQAGEAAGTGDPAAGMTIAPTLGSDISNMLRAQFMESVEVPGREATALTNAEPPRTSRGWTGFEDRTAARVKEAFGPEHEQRYREGEEAYGKLGFPLVAGAALSFGPIDAPDIATLAKRGLKFVPGLGMMKIHHGSPNKFAQPRVGVGKGEGGRSGYGMAGYGAYAADRPGVANNYLTAGGAPNFKVNGEAANANNPKHAIATWAWGQRGGNPGIPPPRAVRDAIEDSERYIDDLTERIEGTVDVVGEDVHIVRMGRLKADRERWIAEKRELENYLPGNEYSANPERIPRVEESKGHKYEWQWDVEPEDVLMWDRPLSEQSPKVQRALETMPAVKAMDETDAAAREAFGAKAYPDNWRTDLPASALYRRIAEDLGDERLASEALREAGIPGHRFEDYTRGRYEAARDAVAYVRKQTDDLDEQLQIVDDVISGEHAGKAYEAEGEKVWSDARQILEGNDPRTYNSVIYDTSKITAMKRDGKPIPYDEFVREMGTPESVARQAALDVSYLPERGRGDRAKNEVMQAVAESNALTEQEIRAIEPVVRDTVAPVLRIADGVDDAARMGRGPFGPLTVVDDGPVEALAIPKLTRGGRKGKARIMANPNPVKSEADKSLISAHRDAKGNLRRSLNSDPLDGLPNLVEQGGRQRIVAHGAGGREIVLGKVGPDDIERHIKSMPSKERFDARPFYDHLHPLFKQAFGDRAERNMMIWAMSNKNEPPSGAMGIMLRSTEQWDAIDRSLRDTAQFGLSTKNIQKFLMASGLEGDEALAIAAKLHDFFDATHGVRLRSFMGFDKRGLRPGPIDIHAQRSNGYLTEKYRNRLLGKGGKPGVVTDPAERALIEAAPLDVGAPKGPSYERPLRTYNEVAQRFNDQKYMGFDDWEAKHVQAIDWAYIQRAQGMEPEDPLHMFMQRMSSMPVEMDPGEGAEVVYREAWNALDDAKKRGVTTEMVEAVVRDLGEVLGIQTVPDMTPASGIYRDWVNPNSIADNISTADAAEDLSRSAAYALSQTEGLTVRVDPTKDLMQSATKWAPDETLVFDITGTGLEDDAKRIEFFQELRERGFAQTDIWDSPEGMMKVNVRGEDGIRILFDSSPDKGNREARKRWLGAIADLQGDIQDGDAGAMFGAVQDAAEEVGLEGDIFFDKGRGYARRQNNDWKKEATRQGEGHLSHLQRSRGEVFVRGLERYRSSFVAPYAQAQIEAARTGVAAPPRESFPLPHELSFGQRTGEPRARMLEQNVGGTFGGQYPRIRRPVQFNMSRDFPPVLGSGGPGAGMDVDRQLQEKLRSHSPARKPR